MDKGKDTKKNICVHSVIIQAPQGIFICSCVGNRGVEFVYCASQSNFTKSEGQLLCPFVKI